MDDPDWLALARALQAIDGFCLVGPLPVRTAALDNLLINLGDSQHVVLADDRLATAAKEHAARLRKASDVEVWDKARHVATVKDNEAK